MSTIDSTTTEPHVHRRSALAKHQGSLFAPPGHVMLLEALSIAGKILDADWTGDEPLAHAFTECSIEDLNQQAAAIFVREFLNDPPSSRSEDEVRSTVHERYQRENAPRVRRQAMVMRLRTVLVAGSLKAIADAASGEVVAIPPHVWRAAGAEEIFDTGLVWVSSGVAAFRTRLCPGESTGVVMIGERDLRHIVDRMHRGELVGEPVAPEPPQLDPMRTGYPGRSTLRDEIAQEFRRRVAATEHCLTLHAEATALSIWALDKYSRKVTAKTIENNLRPLYAQLVRTEPLK